MADDVPPPAASAPDDAAWTVGDAAVTAPATRAEEAWVAPDAVVAPAPARAAAPLESVPPVPVPVVEVPEPAPEIAPEIASGPRRARRSLFGYTRRDAEPAPIEEPVAAEVTPAAVVDAAEWSPSPAPEPAVEWQPAPEPAVEWQPAPEPAVEWQPAPEPAVEWQPAPEQAVELQPSAAALEWPAAAETPAAPEGATGVTDWLLPANDDLLPEY